MVFSLGVLWLTLLPPGPQRKDLLWCNQPDEGERVKLFPKALRQKRCVALGAASVLGLAALAALPSAAASGRTDPAEAFAKLDRNGDGVLSYQEFTGK